MVLARSVYIESLVKSVIEPVLDELAACVQGPAGHIHG